MGLFIGTKAEHAASKKPKGRSKGGQAFDKQFAAARAKGLKVFSYKGKSFNTQVVGKAISKPKAGGGRTTKAAAAVVKPRSSLVPKTAPRPTPRPTPKGQAPSPGLSGLPGMFGRGIGPGQERLAQAEAAKAKANVTKPNVPIPKPRPSGLPAVTTATPASRKGAEIQTIAAANKRNPRPADPALVAKFAKREPEPIYDTPVGPHRGTLGAPQPQGSAAAQQAAARAKARPPVSTRPVDPMRTATDIAATRKKMQQSTGASAQKGNRLGKPAAVASVSGITRPAAPIAERFGRSAPAKKGGRVTAKAVIRDYTRNR